MEDRRWKCSEVKDYTTQGLSPETKLHWRTIQSSALTENIHIIHYILIAWQ